MWPTNKGITWYFNDIIWNTMKDQSDVLLLNFASRLSAVLQERKCDSSVDTPVTGFSRVKMMWDDVFASLWIRKNPVPHSTSQTWSSHFSTVMASHSISIQKNSVLAFCKMMILILSMHLRSCTKASTHSLGLPQASMLQSVHFCPAAKVYHTKVFAPLSKHYINTWSSCKPMANITAKASHARTLVPKTHQEYITLMAPARAWQCLHLRFAHKQRCEHMKNPKPFKIPKYQSTEIYWISAWNRWLSALSSSSSSQSCQPGVTKINMINSALLAAASCHCFHHIRPHGIQVSVMTLTQTRRFFHQFPKQKHSKTHPSTRIYIYVYILVWFWGASKCKNTKLEQWGGS